MNIFIKRVLIKTNWIFAAQLGFDLRMLLRACRRLPMYLCDLIYFRRVFTGNLEIKPCLQDCSEEGGVTKSEYFWQDLFVARLVYNHKPIKHVDIGSRVDGFVAHVASFRECEVFDVRPIPTEIEGIVFHKADLMNPALLENKSMENYCDSISCLHAVEHFGLGRYGDPINVLGYKFGIANMAHLLMPGGILYLSTPIGEERVEFNANWVFDPRNVVRCAQVHGMVLQKLIIININTGPVESRIDDDSLALLASQRYNLGLFVFLNARTK